jgi:hypothetical protein
MKFTRIYTDETGESHFEEVDLTLRKKGEIGALSDKIPVKGLIFRETPADYDYDFHHAPARQFIVLLDGIIEIEVSTGEQRIFKQGDILLVEDTSGKGHRTKSLNKKVRKSLFITLDE